MSDRRHDTEEEMTFFGHIDALRPHLVRGATVILVLMVVAFFSKKILVDDVLFGPLSASFPTNRLLTWLATVSGIEGLTVGNPDLQLISTTMAGQLNLHLKIAAVTAFALGFPYMLWEIWRFVRPALTERELQGCRQFVGFVSLGFFAGLLFGYFVIAPFTVGFLTQYNVSDTVVNMIDVNSYLSTIVDVSIACAVVFQLPLLIYFLTRMGFVTPDFLRRYRRHAIIALGVLSALITPPDAFSMVMVMLPLLGLYQYSIRISERTLRRHRSDE